MTLLRDKQMQACVVSRVLHAMRKILYEINLSVRLFLKKSSSPPREPVF